MHGRIYQPGAEQGWRLLPKGKPATARKNQQRREKTRKGKKIPGNTPLPSKCRPPENTMKYVAKSIRLLSFLCSRYTKPNKASVIITVCCDAPTSTPQRIGFPNLHLSSNSGTNISVPSTFTLSIMRL